MRMFIFFRRKDVIGMGQECFRSGNWIGEVNMDLTMCQVGFCGFCGLCSLGKDGFLWVLWFTVLLSGRRFSVCLSVIRLVVLLLGDCVCSLIFVDGECF